MNWNGSNDTVECLRSLQAMSYDDYFVVVGDNGSGDDSISVIGDYCRSSSVDFKQVTFGDICDFIPVKRSVILYDLCKNNGFSRGNNLLLRFSRHFNPEYFLLLNNDTIVTPDFLSRLLEFRNVNKGYKVLTPLILYNKNRELVWNAGGKLFLGFRKYYYANKRKDSVIEKSHKNITFVTGCALFFSPDILDEQGNVFTEKFFFGEEDFEFSLRMKRNGVKMACVVNSVIYHKVGSSINRQKYPGKLYIHNLNRLIDIRHNYGSLFYKTWWFLYKHYLKRILRKTGCPVYFRKSFINRLTVDSVIMDSVTYDDFRQILTSGWSGIYGRKKRVLYLADSSSNHTMRWVKATVKRGYEVALFTLNNAELNYYNALGVNVYSTGIYNRIRNKRSNGHFEKLSYLRAYPLLRRCVREFQPDILHAHIATSYGLLASLAQVKPTLLSMWGSDIYYFPKVSPLHRSLLKYNFKKSDFLLSTSNCMACEASRYTDKPIAVTPFGVDTDQFSPITYDKKNTDTFTVGTIKTLDHNSGIDILISAFARLKQANMSSDIRLLIAGSGPKENDFKEQAKSLCIEDYVEFVGYVPNADVPDFLSRLDVYSALSRKESFGVAALEAMACEVPVLVSDADGFCEIVKDGETGWIVERENAEMAYKSLSYILNHRSEACKIGKNGRKHVVEKYSWNVSVDIMMNIYNNIFNGSENE
ncbi:MAG: glycosyltransferase [Bacteroidaceae bacterium]|nr:glycosyltransferase [Bacteroidaceae bacterium]